MKPDKIITKYLKQRVLIRAGAERVYDSLTNPKLHSEFTGEIAKGTDKIGEFSTYGGYSFGKNVRFVKNKKIIQTWSCTDWPKGHYSEVSYELKRVAEGTKLTFIQKGIPREKYKSIKYGWSEFYWKPIKKMLE